VLIDLRVDLRWSRDFRFGMMSSPRFLANIEAPSRKDHAPATRVISRLYCQMVKDDLSRVASRLLLGNFVALATKYTSPGAVPGHQPEPSLTL